MKKNLNVLIEEEILKQIKAQAALEGIKLSDMIELVIFKYLKQVNK